MMTHPLGLNVSNFAHNRRDRVTQPSLFDQDVSSGDGGHLVCFFAIHLCPHFVVLQ
jgi:hypothetical protein